MSEYYLGSIVFDITGSIKDYEYTKKTIVNYNRMIESGQFEEMAPDAIFRYLTEQMEMVSFGDYLRRYIYEGSGMTVPFGEVPEKYYIDYISQSFAMNRAPHSFGPVKTRWSGIIKRWLRSDSVKRSSVFLLGFGLNMRDTDVSAFLTKVLKEQDFRFEVPEEAVFWHCYHHGLPYSRALELLEYQRCENRAFSSASSQETEGGSVQGGSDNTGDASVADAKFWESVRSVLPVYLSNESKLREYLLFLRQKGQASANAVFTEFQQVYERALGAAAQVMREEGTGTGKEEKIPSAYDIENMLNGAAPRTASKNLPPLTRSLLFRHFHHMRLSRQRISRLLRRDAEPSRFDILTLLFLIYAVEVDKEWPDSRYIRFVDEANAILARCRMMGLYPVNPYECFILMCLLTEEPLAVYNDVWEMSYNKDAERDSGSDQARARRESPKE